MHERSAARTLVGGLLVWEALDRVHTVTSDGVWNELLGELRGVRSVMAIRARRWQESGLTASMLAVGVLLVASGVRQLRQSEAAPTADPEAHLPAVIGDAAGAGT